MQSKIGRKNEKFEKIGRRRREGGVDHAHHRVNNEPKKVFKWFITK